MLPLKKKNEKDSKKSWDPPTEVDPHGIPKPQVHLADPRIWLIGVEPANVNL